jgi:hypothetical protein
MNTLRDNLNDELDARHDIFAILTKKVSTIIFKLRKYRIYILIEKKLAVILYR